MTTMVTKTIAVLGGTGAEGSGLAFRWAHAGLQVILGSRDAGKASAVASTLNSLLNSDNIVGASNLDAAAQSDLAVLTVPYAVQRTVASEVKSALKGKILIDVTVPLLPPRVDRVQLPKRRSAVAQLQEELGPEISVVAAFQNISAHHLKDINWKGDCDVLVCGDSSEARETTIELAKLAGFRGVHAGGLENAAAVEALTSVLIVINKRYKVAGSGIRITGLPEADK
jgi:NADPH-dependent F420 reductase